MFRSMMRDFDEDPFYNVHRENMRRMDQMMSNFMNPFESLFGDMGFPRLMAPELETHPHNQRPSAGGGGGGLMPFGFGRSMFPNMRDMFSDFEGVQGHNQSGYVEQLANDPNCHSYSSSSVLTYTTGEDGAPKVYQASSSTRTAPGGVKETRKTVSDSASGMKKMAIGHHLGERAHIIEKTQYGGGQQEEAQEFINLEEEEADHFNREWMNNTQQRPMQYNALQAPENNLRRHYIDDEPRALPPPPTRKRENKDTAVKQEKSRRKMFEKLKKPKPKTEN